jgi:NitT/TauT family transport system substrate-binding protein
VSFSTFRRIRSVAIGAVVGLVLGGLLVSVGPAGASTPAQGDSKTIKLGYFDNVTHAPALVGLEGGIFEKNLGKNITLETSIFNAGPAAVTALLSGAIDATYIGPNPTVTAFQQSDGAVQVISGAASGGAFLVVKPDIKNVKALKGKTLATPQLGNTQDVALRSYLKKKGLETDTAGGGDVAIHPQDNAITLQAFQDDQIQGAWVPEPWATRLVNEGGGKILVDERDLWPNGAYVTTDLLVRKDYLDDNPDVVQKLLQGQVEAVDLINTKPAEAQKLVGDRINTDTGKPLSADLIAASFKNIVFTNDPIASSLVASAKAAADLGLPNAEALTKADVKALYNLKLLNKVLKAGNQPAIPTPR